jgi:hypothetical protein
VIACGALSGHIREIAARHGWPVELHSLPSLLHNRPERIAPAAERLARDLQARGLRVALGYADCGSYGALDELCDRLNLRRLPGLHCYDVLAGADRLREMFEREPGTYLLTDFLVRSFRRSVLAELGLDRHPELWPDYFGHYRRLVWLAQAHDPGLDAEAAAIAGLFGLPLTVLDVGTGGLEAELALLVAKTAPGAAPATPDAASPTAPGAPEASRAPGAPRAAPPATPQAASRTTLDAPDAPKTPRAPGAPADGRSWPAKGSGAAMNVNPVQSGVTQTHIDHGFAADPPPHAGFTGQGGGR